MNQERASDQSSRSQSSQHEQAGSEFHDLSKISIVRKGERAEEPAAVVRTQEQLDRDIVQLAEQVARLDQNLDKVIVGMRPERRLMIISPFVGRHILIEGMPGLAKTLLCRSFAESMGLEFQRIQFTPDLTANDIIGFQRPNGRGEFEFQPGPIFGNIILADEINRAPGKTQSALLQAMQEGEVTVDRTTFLLPKPFLVMATQNPLEISSATYPLPDAQLDRIGVKSIVAYPSREENLEIAVRDTGSLVPKVDKIYSREEAEELFRRGHELARGVQIEQQIMNKVVDMCRALNPRAEKDNSFLDETKNGTIISGPSPRAASTVLRYAQGVAVLDGRSYVVTEDVHEIALPVLRHRVELSGSAIEDGKSVDAIVNKAVIKALGNPKR